MKVFSCSMWIDREIHALFDDGRDSRRDIDLVIVAPKKADAVELAGQAGMSRVSAEYALRLRTGMLPTNEQRVFEAGIVDRTTPRVVVMVAAGEGPVIDITSARPVEVGRFVLQGRTCERVAVKGARG